MVSSVKENSASAARLARSAASSAGPRMQQMPAPSGGDTVKLSAEAVEAMNRSNASGEAPSASMPKLASPSSGGAGMSRAIASYLNC